MSAPVQLSRKKASQKSSARWDALNELCAFAVPADLTPVQKVAHLAYWYASLVEAGGHHEYFSHLPRPEHDEVLTTLQTIGASEQATILAAAREAVTAASRRAPDEYTDRYATGVDFADFEEFDQAFARCVRPISSSLMDYLDKHEREFIEWKP